MARLKKPLTNTAIRVAKTKESDYTLHDGGGLYLLVKSSGSKLWHFSYYRPVTKKRALMSLGKYPDVSLSEARERREKARSLLAQGIDPQEHKKQLLRLEVEKMAYSFERVAHDWFLMKKAEGLARGYTTKHMGYIK